MIQESHYILQVTGDNEIHSHRKAQSFQNFILPYGAMKNFLICYKVYTAQVSQDHVKCMTSILKVFIIEIL